MERERRGGRVDVGHRDPPAHRQAPAQARAHDRVAEVEGRASIDLTTAEDRVLLGVEHGDLAGALDGLSPELRAVVQATVLDGLTTREAARLLGIPPGTVKTRMLRARTQLRGALA